MQHSVVPVLVAAEQGVPVIPSVWMNLYIIFRAPIFFGRAPFIRERLQIIFPTCPLFETFTSSLYSNPVFFVFFVASCKANPALKII